jgi:hypothetical protein
MRVTLHTTGTSLTLDLAETVRVIDPHTIELDCPADLDGGRMPVEAWQVLDLYRLGDTAGLAEIGVTVVGVGDTH